MHRKPDIVLIAPHMMGQSDGHRRGAFCPSFSQTLMRDHKIVEADDQPDPSLMAHLRPRQTPCATTQRSDPSPKRAIPSFHKRRLNGGAQPPFSKLFEKPSRTSKDDLLGDFNKGACCIPDLDHLGVKEVIWGDQSGLGLSAHFALATETIDPSEHLNQGSRIGLPAIGEEHRDEKSLATT